jgi:hypothetical protein
MNKENIILSFAFLLILSACAVKNSTDNGNVLARVGDYYLYELDLEGAIPESVSAKDSLTIARNYINTWVREKLLLYQAEKNLTEDQKNFDKQIETYRNSLIIYQYESLLIKQQLSNEVTDEEIEEYYEKNKNNFELKKNIVKADYAILDIDSPYNDKIESLMRSNNMDFIDSLETYCELYARTYLINDDQWISFDELLNIIPIKTYNQEAFLKNNRFVEIEENNFKYFIKFIEFSVKDEISPLSFERENIISIILNKRKIELINKMHNQLFEDALNSDIVEIY